MKKIALGVNIDHVATLRNARGTLYPNPIAAAALAEKAGADQITVHLREDRRHIRDEDVRELRRTVSTALNLEMAAVEEILVLACQVKPDGATLVPEKRKEQTTEGGLNVVALKETLQPVVHRLKTAGIEVSLFIEPEGQAIDAAIALGADRIELHTGRFCEQIEKEAGTKELKRLKEAAQYAKEKGLFVAAGHGLNYDNMEEILREIPEIEEYNIGHSIVSRAVFVGLERAVEEMRELIQGVLK
ncbi:MAG: pyridoxine 5'-phosphate synthase [Deltaproteobacteria bacterium]|nr:pyridoxine 5'-phosphate synthase [Deltaproteobacteria bacterium]